MQTLIIKKNYSWNVLRSIRFHAYLHRQILILVALSVVPGFGYVILSWLYGFMTPVMAWYVLFVLHSLWGYRIYRHYLDVPMGKGEIERWYRQLTFFMYGVFLLWTLIFAVYVLQTDRHLHYIAVFTQIGAAVVAATLLSSDKQLYRPTIATLMLPLIIYFLLIGEWYGYILTYFAVIFTWVLFYGSRSSYDLLTQAEYEATHDHLTGLYNRYNFLNIFQRHINNLRESGGYSYLMLIDLDHFKSINDSLGHEIGDRLLQEVASRMAQLCDKETVARLGGDEFVVIGGRYEDKKVCDKAADTFSQKLQDAMKERFMIDRHHLFVSASIGISLIDKESSDAGTFIKEADIAMYEVKANGRNDVFFFDKGLSERIEKRLTLERLLHLALENNEISLNYQPQLNNNQKVTGCEVLARWNNDTFGEVSPEVFIPLAESTGLIIEIGRYILEEAFKTLAEFEKRGIVLENFSINVSIRQFLHNHFYNDVQQLCEQYLGAESRQKITFEITESILAEDLNKVVEVMREVRTLGIRFSLDDFGTGYSSLSYLKSLPIDELKIDRSFVSELPEKAGGKMMVSTILGLAQNFNLTTVAEGIEKEEQFEFLFQKGCTMAQGFFFSKPVDKEAFTRYYTQQET